MRDAPTPNGRVETFLACHAGPHGSCGLLATSVSRKTSSPVCAEPDSVRSGTIGGSSGTLFTSSVCGEVGRRGSRDFGNLASICTREGVSSARRGRVRQPITRRLIQSLDSSTCVLDGSLERVWRLAKFDFCARISWRFGYLRAMTDGQARENCSAITAYASIADREQAHEWHIGKSAGAEELRAPSRSSVTRRV